MEKDGGGRRRWKQKEEDYKEELLTVEAPEVKCVASLIVRAQLSPCLGSCRQLRGRACRRCLPQVSPPPETDRQTPPPPSTIGRKKALASPRDQKR